MSLPEGEDQTNIAQLLVNLPDSIKGFDKNIEVQDIVFRNELNNDGVNWPSFTVYYYTDKA